MIAWKMPAARRLRVAIDTAEAFAAGMPSDKAGRLFLKDGKPVQPDPANLAAVAEHRPQRRGHWPTSPELTSAILDWHLLKGQPGGATAASRRREHFKRGSAL